MDKIEKEKQIVLAMINLYCSKKHKTHILCSDCLQLKIYAFNRLDKCHYGENKPSCKNCSIHCYQQIMRNKIRIVMRFSGPRMLFYYPFQFLKHKLF